MFVALRWVRRTLDGLLVVAIIAVSAVAAMTVFGQIQGGRALILDGGSMEPTLPRGAYVLVLPVRDQVYRVGDVVTVVNPGRTPFTHRVTRLVEIAAGHFLETKGDANPEPEPVVVPYSAIAGRLVFFVPLLGYLAMLLTSPLGLAGFLFVGGFVLSLIWLIEEFEQGNCPICAAAAAAVPATTAPAAAAPMVMVAAAAAGGVALAVAESVTGPVAEEAAAERAALLVGLDGTDQPVADTEARGAESLRHSNGRAIRYRATALAASDAARVEPHADVLPFDDGVQAA